MYGENSEFGPIDLLGSLGTNIAATHFAVQNDSMRVGIKVKGEVPAYGDFRFLGGLLAAAVAQFAPIENPSYNAVRRGGHDLATGLLNSYVATETCRRKAIQNLKAEGQQTLEMRPQISEQIPAGAAAPAPEAAPAAGNPNFAYGW